MFQRQRVGGVQPWSVGEIYPYHIVVVDKFNGGVVFAQGPSGKLSEHGYTNMGLFIPEYKRMDSGSLSISGSFKAAHRAAECDARRQILLDAQDETPKVAV